MYDHLWDTFDLDGIYAQTVKITGLSVYNNVSYYGFVEVEFYGVKICKSNNSNRNICKKCAKCCSFSYI